MTKKQIKQSDDKITNALCALDDTERGRQTMRDFKAFVSGPAMGLDMMGCKAVMDLAEEFFKTQRRDFLDRIQ